MLQHHSAHKGMHQGLSCDANESSWTRPLNDILCHCDKEVFNVASLLVLRGRAGFLPLYLHQHPLTSARTRITCVESDLSLLTTAKERLQDVTNVRFVQQVKNTIPTPPACFDTSIFIDNAATDLESLQQSVAELSRVTKASGNIVIALPTSTSFSLFDDFFAEAIWSRADPQLTEAMEKMIFQPVTSDALLSLMQRYRKTEGRQIKTSWTIRYPSVRSYFESTIFEYSTARVKWAQNLPKQLRVELIDKMTALYLGYRGEGPVVDTVEATLLIAKVKPLELGS